jgi:hypothetical protein
LSQRTLGQAQASGLNYQTPARCLLVPASALLLTKPNKDGQMTYTQVPESYKYEVIADAIYGREMEYFHYDFDLKNFQYLAEILPEGEYKQDIKSRITDIKKQMGNVSAIHHALQVQIRDKEAYAKAVALVTKRREEKANEICSCHK